MRTPLDPQRLTRCRVEQGLTQNALARAVGVSKQMVSMVSLGKANFSPETLAKVAEVLDCTIRDLLPEEDAEVLAKAAEVLGCEIADLLPEEDAEVEAQSRGAA